MKKTLLSLVLSCFLVSTFTQNAMSKSSDIDERVSNFVQSMSDEAIGIASDESISVDDRREKLIDLFNETVDLDWVTRFIMGKHYRSASNKQREEFLRLYKDYLIRVYAPRFNGYDGKEFSILHINSEYKNEYIVDAKYVSNDNMAIFIGFLVVYNPELDKFFVNDFVAEGISFIVSQRSEINAAISKEGLNAFLDELQDRVDKMHKEGGNGIKKAVEKQ